jgi:peptide deformylase
LWAKRARRTHKSVRRAHLIEVAALHTAGAERSTMLRNCVAASFDHPLNRASGQRAIKSLRVSETVNQARLRLHLEWTTRLRSYTRCE